MLLEVKNCTCGWPPEILAMDNVRTTGGYMVICENRECINSAYASIDFDRNEAVRLWNERIEESDGRQVFGNFTFWVDGDHYTVNEIAGLLEEATKARDESRKYLRASMEKVKT